MTDIVERLRQDSELELTPAQYWEAQASMWQKNYQESEEEVKRQKILLNVAAATIDFANGEIDRLRKRLMEKEK